MRLDTDRARCRTQQRLLFEARGDLVVAGDDAGVCRLYSLETGETLSSVRGGRAFSGAGPSLPIVSEMPETGRARFPAITLPPLNLCTY